VYATFYLHGRGLACVEVNGITSHFQRVQSLGRSRATAHTGHPFDTVTPVCGRSRQHGEHDLKRRVVKKASVTFPFINTLLSLKSAPVWWGAHNWRGSCTGSGQQLRWLLEAAANACDSKEREEHVPGTHSCLCSFTRLCVTAAASFAPY